ncbi:MAG: HAD family hydrolase [Proteobacteria bacterium]|nr:HAD family hydrolase [Pseudomonadota bacterium]
MSRPRLLLFDIDQTLIDTAGVGMRALRRALEEVAGLPPEAVRVSPDGKTDPAILSEIIEATGHAIGDLEAAVWASYALYLGEALRQVDARRQIKPGVPALLAALANEPQARLGLLTGNLEHTARIKLGAFALDHYFAVGGFGSDSADRCALGPVALRRACAHFDADLVAAETWVIGDTPRDVDAAHAFGARALAVATGRSDVDALAATGAEAVLPDLSDTQAVVTLLLS